MLRAASTAEQHARTSIPGLERAVIYQIWLRSFTPDGTLAAAAKRLPHIAELGASIVYLSPIQLESKVGGFSNPYRIKDYAKIDPEYGSEDDLKRFVQEAHRLKLRVLLDTVFFHTAPDNVLIQSHPDYFLHRNGQIVLSQWKLPRPDFSNPALRRYFIQNLLHWLNDGVDGFRCDVAFRIPLDFWEQARRELQKANPSLVMLAESDRAEDLLDAFDISYNFPYLKTLQDVFHGGLDASEIRRQWETSERRFPRGALLLRASDNHDQERAIVLFSQSGALAASVLNFTMDGIPFLYNGQEIGDTVTTDHESHYPIRWELDKTDDPTVAGVASKQQELSNWYRKLFALRAAEPALYAGRVKWIGNSMPRVVISFERQSASSTVIVLVNSSNHEVRGTVSARVAASVLLSAKGAKLDNGAFRLGAFGYVVARTTGSK